MSKATQEGKVEEQAKKINNQNQIIEALQRMVTNDRLRFDAALAECRRLSHAGNYLAKELYKLCPDHETFKGQNVDEIKSQIEGERAAAEQAKTEPGRAGQRPG